MAGIYIHIPFCRQACHYCDFHFSTNLENQDKLISSIREELIAEKHFLQDQPVETIYFGGGSPSLLSFSQISSLLEALYSHFNVISHPEITLEGNPDDLTADYLKTIASLGINRLSIGIQSFDEKNLRFLNRVHNSQQSKQCLNDAREAGFDNFSLDLIYGIPSADHTTWKNDIELALSFNPNHISAYCLTIEEKTVFGNWQRKGKLKPIDEDFAAEQYELLIDQLGQEGYEHYEISNFALPGFYSKHNTSYWQQKNYLGVGPGAHSYNGRIRRFNVENNNKYIKAIASRATAYSEEVLSVEDKINEYLLTTLRTIWGSDLALLKSAYQFDLLHVKNDLLEQLSNQGLIRLDQHRLYLTKPGRLLADKITEELMVDSQK